ncbi:hypothetical protein EV210_12320 [Anaerospora hongkongensis]|uniref:Helix-turn-helix domain-containing protein n=1 Tax=Anaerospora hongkongensis TaxID=244830 RepID=A0A4R1PPA0_9FIRM|nr:helix-turn-helix domain-containing protein [Anaerospora hongkongensis]TCL32200.1 hypothetical protein EV210_12320 [Anaerospora hongkongensis]
MAKWSQKQMLDFVPVPIPEMDRRLAVSPQEAAQISGRTENTILNWIAADELIAVKINKRLVIPLKALEKKIDKCLCDKFLYADGYTLQAAADLLGVNKKTLRRAVNNLPLEVYMEHRFICVSGKSLKKMLDIKN